jgi:hypothetical protein
MICSNQECQKDFLPATHNQIYCSPECCRTTTNKRIKADYHAKKARLRGEARYCSCGSALSRYNKYSLCSECGARRETSERHELLEMFGVHL